MRELLETLDTWRADPGSSPAVGRAVVVRTFGSAPRPEGAVLLYADDGRIAGSVSGGCVEGAAAEEIDRARSTGRARVIRYGISDEQAWDVGLACGGTIDVLVQPAVPAPVVDAARASLGAGGRGAAVVTRLPGEFAAGRLRSPRAGQRRAPRARADRARRRSPRRHARPAGPGRRPGRGSARSAEARHVPDAGARWRVVLRRGVPGAAAARRRRRGGGRALARPAGRGAWLRDGRRRWPGLVRHPGTIPRRGSAGRRLARRDRRRHRTGPERRGCRADPRREVRRAGDRRIASPPLPLRRGGGIAQDPGGPSGTAARRGGHR